MLTVYRRHLPKCTKARKIKRPNASAAELNAHMKCACPLWLMGVDSRGVYHRESLGTRELDIAEDHKRDIDRGIVKADPVTPQQAVDAWIKSAANAGIVGSTRFYNYAPVGKAFTQWTEAKGITRMSEITLDLCTEFVESWNVAPSTRRTRLALLRLFFGYCVPRKWISENWAKHFKAGRIEKAPTLPYSSAEIDRLLTVARSFPPEKLDGEWMKHVETAKGLMLVMLHTGLRISDALQFDINKLRRVNNNRGREVWVYETTQAKTKEWILCPLADDVVAELQTVPRISEEYTFLRASEFEPLSRDEKTAYLFRERQLYARSYLRRLGKLAQVNGVRPHRFRDTFAVNLLNRGVSLENVSALLGHTSINTTQQHYAPWVKSRIDALISAVSDI